MISASDISELIRHPELTANYNSTDLSEIRNKFPYCSSLHLLYLKSLSLTTDLHFEEHLRFAAAHIMDRERMYYLIHSGENTKDQSDKVNTTVEKIENISSSFETLHTEYDEPEIQKTNKPTQNTITEETLSEDDTISPELKQSNLLETAPDLLDIAYHEDLTTETDSVQPIKEKTELLELENKMSQESLELNQESTAQIITTVDLSKLTFIEWLHYKQSNKLPLNQSSPELIKDEKIAVDVEIKKEKKANLSRADVDALLNKFITEEPSMPRTKATFFSPTKTAKQSLEEAPDLVTETLAKIYVLQKNYSKAIQAYQQLSLVYPEKKTFFASRIQKIKEEQNKQ